MSSWGWARWTRGAVGRTVGVAGGLVGALVGPPRCAACDGEVPYGTAFCPPCAATLVRLAPSDPSRLAVFAYGGAIGEALRRFKFGDRPDLAPALVSGLATQLPRLTAAQATLVVPVPLHAARLVERGYNQAALLARPMARMLGVRCAPRALSRPFATERQTDLNRAARAANIAKAFVAEQQKRIAGAAVLLVDDVETTGSTLDACRDALMAGGAREVTTLVVARSLETAADAAQGEPPPGERQILRNL